MICFGSGRADCGYTNTVLLVEPSLSVSRDICSVCGGDNSSCLGCDGVPFSSAVLDQCGVCGPLAHDGLSCSGCMDPRASNFDSNATNSLWHTCEYEGECSPDEALSCDGLSCSHIQYIGDGICDGLTEVNGVNMNCSQHGYDGGDCLGACDSIHITGCDGHTCLPSQFWGDGFCDEDLNCEAVDMDHGDCSDTCAEGIQSLCASALLCICRRQRFHGADCSFSPSNVSGDIEDCSGNCVAARWHGDGLCDDGVTSDVDLSCDQMWSDLGDCEQEHQCVEHVDCLARETDEALYCNAQTACRVSNKNKFRHWLLGLRG